VTYVELSEKEEGLVLATLDPIGAMAHAEATALESLLGTLDPADADLRAFIDELARQQETRTLRAGLVDPDAGWKDGAAHAFHGGRTQDTVWEIPRPRRSETHPTTKPVELVLRALTNSSSPGDLVYEPFAGSGPTIIAAEQTGRPCVAMEIDPHYAQVAIERWASFTSTAVSAGASGWRPNSSSTTSRTGGPGPSSESLACSPRSGRVPCTPPAPTPRRHVAVLRVIPH
jgi:hypothetical protein